MFGGALYRAIHRLEPLEPSRVLMASSSAEFTNPDQIAWAIHVAGMVATIQGLPSEPAYTISAFARGEGAFAGMPASLRALGAYSLLEGAQAQALGVWLGQIDRSLLADEAGDLHGPEWVSSIVSIVTTLQGVFLSTRTHGADLCAWGA